MRMLQWMKSYEAGQDQKRKNKGDNKSWEIATKFQERSFMIREEHYVGRRAMVMKVEGRRKRGRPKRRWLDRVRDAIKEKGLSGEEVYDRTTLRCMPSYIDLK